MLRRLPRLTPRRSPAALLALTLIASLVLAAAVQVSHAQGQELLQNPSFEAYYGTGGGNLAPTGWTLSSNVAVSSSGHTWPGESRTGASWDISAPGTVFIAVGSQFVAGIRSGTKLRFSAWANLFTCNKQNSCIFGNTGHRTSDQTSGAKVRIGVDPQGGHDYNSASVQWSDYASPFDQFSQLIIDTVAQTDNGVTVFIYATQAAPMLLNHVYWDDASLQPLGDGVVLITGAGGATLAPPTSAFAPLVRPQGAQADGSIVHIVGAGDTLASIAYAYKVTVADIRSLNKLDPDNSILQIGQKLIIKPAGSVSVDATEAATGDAGVAANAGIGPVNATLTPVDNGGNTVASQPTVVAPTPLPTTEIPPTPIPPTATVAPTATTIPTGNNTDPMGLPLMPLAQVANAQLAKLMLDGANTALINTQPSVCISAFEDKNANRWQDADEKLLPDVAVKLSHAGQADKTVTTTSDKATCFDAVVPGSYVLMASAPAGYGLTTAGDLEVVAQPGAKLALTFGAASGYKPAPAKADSADTVSQAPVDSSIDAPTTSAQPATTSVITTLFSNSGLIVMGIAGVVLLGGLGTIWMFFRH